jgi:hypothetical protein
MMRLVMRLGDAAAAVPGFSGRMRTALEATNYEERCCSVNVAALGPLQ